MSIRIERNSYIPITAGPARRVSAAPAQAGEAQHFDQILLSAQAAGGDRVRSLTSQVADQLRIRPTAQDLKQLRQDILSGAYRPNPGEIAARMLLMEKE